MTTDTVIDIVSRDDVKRGELKKLAKDIKVNHALALELWDHKSINARLLATLIFDKKHINQDFINKLTIDLEDHNLEERTTITEWLMANQLMKSKPTISLMLSWENHENPLLRRTFWYYQARMRWTGQKSPDNTLELIQKIEKNILDEAPEVQWAMNFTAAWIGVYTAEFRERCIKIGKDSGLYKDEIVAKGCTPSYLPLFIEIEVGKRS